MIIRPASVAGSVLPLLKVIGLLLFVWLLSRIDRSTLLLQLRSIDIAFFIGSFVVLLLADALKVARWHLLLHAAGFKTSFRYAWETYTIGIFLGLITPGKVGEFGRAGYLRKHGMAASTAVAIVLIDRVFDVAVIAFLSLFAVGLLFGAQWFAVVAFVGFCAVCFLVWGVLKARRIQSERPWIAFLLSLVVRPAFLAQLVLLTACSWGVYCVWSVLLAASIGVSAAILPFVSAIILAGVISFLPVAPSGLGTRDASLIWMLAPLGIVASSAIALSFLMFVSIVLNSLIGLWYWLRGVPEPLGAAESGS